MKKLLLFFTILTLTNLNAQEKQNDATWEETVSFINRYKSYIKNIYSYSRSLSKWKNHDVYSINVSGNYLNINGKWGSTNREYHLSFSIPLNKLRYIDKGFRTRLSTTGNNIAFTTWSYLSNKRTQKVDGVSLRIPDSEMRPRLIKALEHLAYLAKKKREEARKNSGEKF